MKFLFPYESLMKHRKLLEEKAKKIYLEAKAKSTEIDEEINNKEQNRKKALDLLLDLKKEGEKKVYEIQSIEDYIKREEDQIIKKKRGLKKLLQVETEKHALFVESSKELKALEILKEKKKEEFKREMEKVETQEIEEMILMGFKNKWKKMF